MNRGGIEILRDNIENFLVLKTKLPHKKFLPNFIKCSPIIYHLGYLLVGEGLGFDLEGLDGVHMVIGVGGYFGKAD